MYADPRTWYSGINRHRQDTHTPKRKLTAIVRSGSQTCQTQEVRDDERTAMFTGTKYDTATGKTPIIGM